MVSRKDIPPTPKISFVLNEIYTKDSNDESKLKSYAEDFRNIMLGSMQSK